MATAMRRATSLLGLLSLLGHSQAQTSCPSGPEVVVYEQAVSINTDVLFNTTFYPVPGYPLTIANAPTSIDEITTLRWTSSRSPQGQQPQASTSGGLPSQAISQSGSSIGPPPQPPSAFTSITVSQSLRSSTQISSNPSIGPATLTTTVVTLPTESTFILGGGGFSLEKRQGNYNFITANGTVTSDCSGAIVYSLSGGQLSANVSGQVLYFSTSPGLSAQPFKPSTTPGSITSTFSIQQYENKQVLQWANDAFYNGFAYFCTLDDGTVYAVFQANAQPDGCFYFRLILYSSATCQRVVIGPTGPSGPTDKLQHPDAVLD